MGGPPWKDPLLCSITDCRALGFAKVSGRDGAGESVEGRLCLGHLARLPSCLAAVAALLRPGIQEAGPHEIQAPAMQFAPREGLEAPAAAGPPGAVAT